MGCQPVSSRGAEANRIDCWSCHLDIAALDTPFRPLLAGNAIAHRQAGWAWFGKAIVLFIDTLMRMHKQRITVGILKVRRSQLGHLAGTGGEHTEPLGDTRYAGAIAPQRLHAVQEDAKGEL